MSVFNVQKDSDYFDRKFPNNTLHSIKSNLSDLQSNEKKVSNYHSAVFGRKDNRLSDYVCSSKTVGFL